MAERKMVSIVLYGNIDSNTVKWLKWYEYSISEISELGFSPNFIGVEGQSFNSEKITLLKKNDKKLRASFDKDEDFTSIALYSLPENFKQAAFDYDIYMSRTTQERYPHIILTISYDNFKKINVNNTIEKLKEHIQFSYGQIFEMSSYESPQFYAAKLNSIEAYKSLKVIQELNS